MGNDINEMPDLARIFASPNRTDISVHYDQRMKKMLAKNMIKGRMCENCEEYWGDDDQPEDDHSNCYRFRNKPMHGTCPWFNIPLIKNNA